ncbi:MAG: serine/threonine-protein kinase [Anaeromyxobacter sp.]
MIRKVGTARIVREIGRGGMGVVYEAVQEALDRPVAVKALDPKLVKHAEVIERFRREGKAYARLRHEAIVAVHDLVEKDDGLWLVTDYVDGADLAKLLAEGGALPPDCAAIVGARVAEALDYVHFEKLLHRDVKPANVMVSRLGEVKLMDFGIAKAETDHALTTDGMLVGSPSYMAPEVLEGAPGSPASDVWALGVSLYELLTGEKPFSGKTAQELFTAIRKGRHRRLRALAKDCPWRLARIVERCLAKHPARRWQSAGALAEALDRQARRMLPRGLHARARLVAMLTHRGFVTEALALTRIELSTLASTAFADAAHGPRTSVEFPRPSLPSPALKLAVGALLAVAAGLTAWLVRM